MAYTVYCHTNKHNGKRYVGVTSQNPYDRWQNGKHYKRHKRFWYDIELYGWEEFTHEIIYTGLTEKEAVVEEKRLIKKWNLTNPKYGYNVYCGGQIVKVSEQTREKLSVLNSGENNHFYGCHHSEKTKRIIRERKAKKSVECIETGEIYKSTREAERITNIGHSEIIKCCKGKQKTAGGFHWNYWNGGEVA